jgi:type IV pilus assembly protein PilB
LATFRSVLGETMAIRLFSKKNALLDFEELGMFPTMARACCHVVERPCGLTLFVGPKGTGKTTSLYSTLQHFNDGTTKIVTLESPVAFALDGVTQNDVSRQPDADLRHMISSLLEHDPDIVALGEITDPRAAEALLRCAMTGHKVFSTMTSEDAAAALVQLGHAEGTTPFLSSCSIAILAQRLVRKVCKYCLEEYVPSADIVRGFHVKDLDIDDIEFRRGRGCAECKGTGFLGRTGIFELLVAEPEIAGLLHGKPSALEIRSAVWKNPSFLSLGEAGFLKAIQGVTTLEEVRRVLSALYEHVPDNRRRTLEELYRVSDVKVDRVLSREENELADVEPQEEGR